MRIAYRFQPDRDFLFRGVMRASFNERNDICSLSLPDVAVLSAIIAGVLWLDVEAWMDGSHLAGALASAALASAGIFGYMICKLVARAVHAVMRIRPGPMPVEMEIEPGSFLRCANNVEDAFDWSAMTDAKKFDDMFILTFRVRPSVDRPVLVARAQLKPDEDAALESTLTLSPVS